MHLLINTRNVPVRCVLLLLCASDIRDATIGALQGREKMAPYNVGQSTEKSLFCLVSAMDVGNTHGVIGRTGI